MAMNGIILAGTRNISRGGRLFFAEFVRAFSEFRYLYAFTLFALLTAFIVGRITHIQSDVSTVEGFGAILANVFLLSGCLAAMGGLVWLGAVKKSASPARDGIRFLQRYLCDAPWLSRALNALLIVTVFFISFGGLKGSIAVLSAFSWDTALAHLDRALAFGHDPYTWLWPVLKSPLAVMALNVLYNVWFFFVLASFLAVAIIRRETLRHQYLMAFMATWFVGGFLIAMGFSSAGPCYFERLGLGHDFDPLMNALQAANRHYGIWALSTQDTLWAGYTGARDGSVGISAFPSMHVATAVLMALFAAATSRTFGLFMWAYAALIVVGSIALGWHYAVDSYASVVIALVFWALSGLYARRRAAVP
jgi:PAP2 superfamily